MNPTEETYYPLTEAYNFFNKMLFEGRLPNCLITMQRKGKAYGYFSPERFESRKGEAFAIHEIALNPSLFVDRSDAEILSTLLHEMVHLWQQENGTAPKRAYHNREWAEKMEEFGLMPSNTGQEGGRKTGSSMSHYIISDGRFDDLIKKFFEVKNRSVLYQDRPQIKINRTKKKNKIKYSCAHCGLNVWGKPNINIMCGSDEAQLIANEDEV